MVLIKIIFSIIVINTVFSGHNFPPEIQFIGTCIILAGWIANSSQTITVKKE